MAAETRHAYRFGLFELDVLRMRLLRDGQPVAVAPKMFDLLRLLVENRGRLLEKRELMERLWPDTVVDEANLSQQIFMLRKMLGEQSDGRPYIDNVARRGYVFTAEVQEIVDPPALAETLPSRKLNPAQRTAAGLLLVAVLAAAILYLSGRDSSPPPNPISAAPRTVAVLPFRSLSSGPLDEYLALGMADAVITRLAQIRGVIVRPTSSVLEYAGSSVDPIATGRELGVDAVLDGSVQRAGERVRVTVQLLNVRDGRPLWGAWFDEQFANIFTVQDRVSEQVARALGLRLTGEEQQRLVKRDTANTEAYQAYLKGRYFWNKRTEDGFKRAIEFFNEAIEKDPGYARAYGGLADSYALLGSMSNAVLPRSEAMPRARAAALKALEIDEALAEAHTSLAFVKMHYEWDWTGAEREFKRAIELNPSYATAHHWYAYNLTAMGRMDEAVGVIKRAQEIDPLSLIINTDVGEVLYYARRYDEAIEQARRTLEMDPNFLFAHRVLAWAYEQKGMYREAIAELNKAVSLPGGKTYLAHVYAVSGQRSKALDMLNELKEPIEFAIVYAGLGERDQAFAWLEKAYERRDGVVVLLKAWPLLDPLRSDPRFAELTRRAGLPR